MLRPLLASRLRSRPVAFEKWRRRAISAVEDDTVEWPLDEYSDVVPGPFAGSADADAAFERVREHILSLRLFPSHNIGLHADTPDRRAAMDATIVQHLFLGPLALESGVRVVGLEDRTDGRARGVSLTWATLNGHPERGIETFSASLDDDGVIRLAIRARSRPALLLVRLGSPVVRRLQVRFSRRSLALLTAAATGTGAMTEDRGRR